MTHRSVAAYPRSMVFPLDSVPIGASQYVIDGEVAAHKHAFVEIAVVLGGSGRHVEEGGSYDAQCGDVFVIHPGVWHAYEHCEQCVIVNCYFGAELLDCELAWLRHDAGAATLLQHTPTSASRQCSAVQLAPEARQRYGILLGQLGQQVQCLRPSMRVECVGLLTAALGVLAQALAPNAPVRSTPVPHPAVLAGKQMLEEQLDHPWTLVELAYQLHVDRSYLVRLFKQHTGLTPIAWLARRRAEQAALLLRTTEQSISAISSAVGWDDLNQFNRRFKAVFGVSASVYRARER